MKSQFTVSLGLVICVLLTACEKPDETRITTTQTPAVAPAAAPATEVVEPTPTPQVQYAPYDGDASGLAEIALIAPLDTPKGWCVDLFAHRTGAQPIGGMQGHNCFAYFEIGSPTEDQGFDTQHFVNTGQLRLNYFDVCMTLQAPEAGSFVAAEPCADNRSQQFVWNDQGEIQPADAPDLCLTLGPTSVPGGGRLRPPNSGRPPVTNAEIALIRRLSFEACEADVADLQRWEFREGDYVPKAGTTAHRFMYTQE